MSLQFEEAEPGTGSQIVGMTHNWKAGEKGARDVGKGASGGPPFLSPVSSHFIFVFALSQFRGPDHLGARNRLGDWTVDWF